MTGVSVWNVLFALLAGYLIGSIPTGVALSRLFRGPDPRTVGSGHTGGTNVFRNVNRPAGVLTGILDLSKGALAAWLVMQVAPSPWLAPLAGTAAVAGQCWPVFANYRGGMGVATAGGLALWFFPLAIPIVAIFFLLLNQFLRHPARAMMITAALIPLILLTLRVDGPPLALAAGLSVVLGLRWASDFFRVYG